MNVKHLSAVPRATMFVFMALALITGPALIGASDVRADHHESRDGEKARSRCKEEGLSKEECQKRMNSRHEKMEQAKERCREEGLSKEECQKRMNSRREGKV